MNKTLYVRSLSRVSYDEGDALSRALASHDDDYLLFLEHDPIYTCGSGTQTEHLRNLSEDEYVNVDRAGSVTYHGPGQLIGYPIISIDSARGDLRSSLTYIRTLQDVLIDALCALGVNACAHAGYTGVWVDRGAGKNEEDRYAKIAAIGLKVAQGRTRHGFALNITTDLSAFDRIIPCGIADYSVTSLEQCGFSHITTEEITETITKHFLEAFDYDDVDSASVNSRDTATFSYSNVVINEESRDIAERTFAASGGSETESTAVARLSSLNDSASDLARFSKEAVSAVQPSLRLLGRLSKAGVAVDLEKDRRERPAWMKNKASMTPGYQELKKLSRELNLHTVCEEAGCPNIYECWESKTATFMILGERCTRACSFCLVDTRKPQAVDKNEPRNVAVAISSLGLDFAVITCVARDDLDDDGAGHFAETVREIRSLAPKTGIELLISDCRGRPSSLETIFNERPDVINHNIETVARIQRAVRPSASYARSLSVLARAKASGLTTKSGIIVGMGETNAEVLQTLRDLRNVGVDIVTIGQYLQPTPTHLPVHRFVNPEDFEMFKEYGELIGISHVESGPLVRSSYHAKSSAQEADQAKSPAQ